MTSDITPSTFDTELNSIITKLIDTYKAGSDVHHPDYFWIEDGIAAIKELVASEVIGQDVEYMKWYRDITDEYDYYYTVKRPMAEKHKNELRADQRKALGIETSHE